MNEIESVIMHRCVDGGMLYEIYRDPEYGQLAVRTVLPGVTVGGHVHPITQEAWIFCRGTAMAYLESAEGIREMRHIDTSNGPVVIPLPAGTGHDVKNIGDDEVVFIFWADRLYSPETHDKEDWCWE